MSIESSDRDKNLEMAMSQIERQFGTGAIMSVLDSAGRQRVLEADSQAALHRVITARTT